MPDDFGQQNCEVEAVPAREENCAYWVVNDATIHSCAHKSPIPCTHCAPPREGQEARLACEAAPASRDRYRLCRPGCSPTSVPVISKSNKSKTIGPVGTAG